MRVSLSPILSGGGRHVVRALITTFFVINALSLALAQEASHPAVSSDTPATALTSGPAAMAPLYFFVSGGAACFRSGSYIDRARAGAGAQFAEPGSGNSSRNVAPGLHALSPWSMFLSADIIVKAVMIGLAFASLVTWTIFLGKSIELVHARLMFRRSVRQIAKARFLFEVDGALKDVQGILPLLVATALDEAKQSQGLSDAEGVKARAASAIQGCIRSESRSIRRGMGLLATIGPTAPFVGLFGTVYGIMNSFIGISKAQTTNLAVVAPASPRPCLQQRSDSSRPFPRSSSTITFRDRQKPMSIESRTRRN